MGKTKICLGKCGLEKEETDENFLRYSSGNFYKKCKICVYEINKQYYENNKERISLKQIENYKNNKTELLNTSRLYYEKNKELILLNKKEYYKNNKLNILSYKKEYYINNKEKISYREKTYRENNKLKIENREKVYRENNKLKISTRSKQYYQINKKELNKKNNKYQKIRRETDLEFKLRKNISAQFHRYVLKTENDSCINYLPYSIKEYRKHIEDNFDPWMNWNNLGNYKISEFDSNPTWNIDHIIPQSFFIHKNEDGSVNRSEVEKCWSIDNLRPLSSKENVIKGNSITNEMIKLLNEKPWLKPDRLVYEDGKFKLIESLNEKQK